MAVRKASTLPSPPSATGTDFTWQPGNTLPAAFAISSHTCREDRVPLKESGAKTIFFIVPSWKDYSYYSFSLVQLPLWNRMKLRTKRTAWSPKVPSQAPMRPNSRG